MSHCFEPNDAGMTANLWGGGRYVTLQMVEVAIPCELFVDILSRIVRLRPAPAPA
jgi:hypothetical protein